MNKKTFIFANLFMVLILISIVLWGMSEISSGAEDTPPPVSRGIIHTDPSARTGFLSTEEYTARFETIDFPIAGESNMDTVCRIDVWKYPSIPGKDPGFEYITDSYEEAVEFLNVLMGK